MNDGKKDSGYMNDGKKASGYMNDGKKLLATWTTVKSFWLHERR